MYALPHGKTASKERGLRMSMSYILIFISVVTNSDKTKFTKSINFPWVEMTNRHPFLLSHRSAWLIITTQKHTHKRFPFDSLNPFSKHLFQGSYVEDQKRWRVVFPNKWNYKYLMITYERFVEFSFYQRNLYLKGKLLFGRQAYHEKCFCKTYLMGCI